MLSPAPPPESEHRRRVTFGNAAHRVIACDLHDADVIANLATTEGRAALVDGVTRLSGGRIDAIVANAGGGPAETMLALNFFGAVATLEGLRPLLNASPAPRAVMVSSIASLSPADPRIVEACLNMDEPAAIAAGVNAIAAGKGTLGSVRQRQACVESLVPNGRGQSRNGPAPDIPLNVVAPGFIDTPAAAYIFSDPERRAAAGADGADARAHTPLVLSRWPQSSRGA